MLKSNIKITYAETWLPFHHRVFIYVVELLSAKLVLEKRYKKFISFSHNKKGTDLWKHALNSMGIESPALDPIPKRQKSRGLIIAANHPFGVADGVFLSWYASTIDPDFKVIANGVLQQEPLLADNILPIEFSNRTNAMRENVYTRKSAIETLKNGGVVAIFPAGAVAWSKKKGLPVKEEAWKPMLGRLINESNCDVMITKFEGQNSNFFQIASRINQTIRQSLFLYEIKKSLDKPMQFSVIKYLNNEKIPELDDKNLSVYLQNKLK